MWRRLLIVALPGLFLTVTAMPSNGGGWDTLPFPKDHYLVSEVATTTRLFFAGALRGAGELDGGPYFSYLLPLQRGRLAGFGMIDPPTIPSGAIRIGMLEVSGPYDRPHFGGPYGRATLTFTVPDVPTGHYSIGFCDDPCRHGYVGWLAWASITIVHTEEEARLLNALDRQAGAMRQLRSQLRRAERGQRDLETTIDSLGADLRERTMALRIADTRLESARPEPTNDKPLITWWETVVLALVSLTTALIVRRRRRPRGLVPETVPEGLVEKETAGV